MADFTIRIPRTGVTVTEAHLVEVYVPEGQRVQEGEPLFLIETEKVETEVPAGASGTVHWTAAVDTTYEVFAEIGVIRDA